MRCIRVNVRATQQLGTGCNQKETLETIRNYLTTERPRTFEDCIAWASILFENEFTNKIQKLLYNLPKDSETSTGTPFWSGPKRAPQGRESIHPRQYPTLWMELTAYSAKCSWIDVHEAICGLMSIILNPWKTPVTLTRIS
ncbi:E1 ubiquitin-activating protein [Fusarium falciforme]